ncbi:hypothetical protein B0T18DRAFT_421909 [Schizothecium vesticola]|uniref:Uncharacterized protein n=1 Tax=Schizothecium vesticola TaxID=314040 RepID=A0AA40EFW4_9PEZI|nr:hypothetical protein B0T18DRAFT_421909 [Schizothecium vesticola]
MRPSLSQTWSSRPKLDPTAHKDDHIPHSTSKNALRHTTQSRMSSIWHPPVGLKNHTQPTKS